MSRDANQNYPRFLQPRAGGRVGGVRKLQFSLSALMLVMALVWIGCATIRLLGFVWFVPVGLAELSAVSLLLVVRCGSDWRMLRLGYWHFAVWLGLAAAASGMTVRGCLDYNAVAGTDKTPGHIVHFGGDG